MRATQRGWILGVVALVGCGGTPNDHAETQATPASGGSGGGVASSGGAAGSSVISSGGTTSTGGSDTTIAGGTGDGGTAVGGSVASGGSAGSPAHVVGECDGLGAVDEFEDITPPGVSLANNGVTDLAVDPINAGTLYVGTDGDGIFKSTNCGADWVKINTGTNGEILESGTAWMVLLDPDHPDVLYSNALYGSDNSLYKSTNGGVDWYSLFPPDSEIANKVEYKFFQWAAMDPTDSQHLLITFHSNCKDPESSDPNAPFDSMCLAESMDAGENWRLFKTNPSGQGWIEGAGPLMFGPSNWGLGTWLSGVYYTTDKGESWEKVTQGNAGVPYMAQDGSYYSSSYYGVQHVTDDGHTWTQVPGSPNTFGMIGDGTRIFASQRDAGDGQPYFTAPENDPTTWTSLASPTMAHGAVRLQYDPDHKLLYSANTSSGLWRMVTQ